MVLTASCEEECALHLYIRYRSFEQGIAYVLLDCKRKGRGWNWGRICKLSPAVSSPGICCAVNVASESSGGIALLRGVIPSLEASSFGLFLQDSNLI